MSLEIRAPKSHPYSVRVMVAPHSPRSVAGCTLGLAFLGALGLAILGALPRTSSGSWGALREEVPQRHGHFSLQGPPGDSLENTCGHDRRIRCTVRCLSVDCPGLFFQTLTTKLPPGRDSATLRRHGNGGMAFHSRLRHQPTIPKNQAGGSPWRYWRRTTACLFAPTADSLKPSHFLFLPLLARIQ